MKKMPVSFVLVTAVCAAVLCGCVNKQKSQFYVLHTPKMDVKEEEKSEKLQAAVIILDRIRLPKFLERPNIVTQVSQSEIVFSEFHRWGGSLASEMTRVISLNLAQILGSNNITDNFTLKPEDSDYHVALQVVSMVGTLGGQASLTTRHWVFQGQEAISQGVVGNYSEKLADGDYTTYVAAQSQMLADLSRDIARSLHEAIGE